MQASVILKKRLSTEWAVVNYRTHVPVKHRTPEQVLRSQIKKVRLQSYEYYRKSSAIRADHTEFDRAPAGSREGKGFLVSDGDHFWVAPSSDFISEFKVCEDIWTAREQAEATAAALRQARQERERTAQQRMYQVATERTQATRSSILAILGRDAADEASFNINGRTKTEDDGRITGYVDGYVSLPIRHFERLIEKYNEALDEAR